MTVKKSLENRIRGWFPHEPTMISTGLKVTRESKQPPLMIPSEYKVSATKASGAFGIFWIIFYGIVTFTFLDLEMYPISIFQIMVWIIVGLAVGVISCTVSTKNQLGRLSKDYQFSANGKDIALILVPFILIFVSGFFVSSSIQSISMHLSTSQGLLISVYVWGVSIQIIKTIMFAAFEKKENMRLMQSWLGTNIFLVPKAPTSKVNRLELATEQNH